jgi:hypothetical protein
MRRAILGPLAKSGADELGDLDLHQLLRDQTHGLADHVTVLLTQHLPDDLLDRHPLGTGHRRPPFIDSVERADDHERHGGRNYVRSVRPAPTPTLGT